MFLEGFYNAFRWFLQGVYKAFKVFFHKALIRFLEGFSQGFYKAFTKLLQCF